MDLNGSHTDYDLGFVLTLAIDRDTRIAARSRTDGQVNMRSIDVEGLGAFHLDAIEPDGPHPGPTLCGAWQPPSRARAIR